MWASSDVVSIGVWVSPIVDLGRVGVHLAYPTADLGGQDSDLRVLHADLAVPDADLAVLNAELGHLSADLGVLGGGLADVRGTRGARRTGGGWFGHAPVCSYTYNMYV
ncbi:hypothetical protein BAY61_14540 [Prauserella marina]|uniref:Uncharacterized protein n=1 Tax=Prauserella marina TaxID=530584 RepID=A0A222VQ26_9PSEU|nr:hypothetical protein BAY61_14540 [Prauserella marina]PWV84032.1 hypothetical protein DES30_10149 [Prauserella marina]SDC32051.1 hypothetical protein SAMN05421630_1011288 [Prauserella marina]